MEPHPQKKSSLEEILSYILNYLPEIQRILKVLLPQLVPQKRPPGRPRLHQKPNPNLPKRPPGRPRIHPKPDPSLPKRPPGRPRKIQNNPEEITTNIKKQEPLWPWIDDLPSEDKNLEEHPHEPLWSWIDDPSEEDQIEHNPIWPWMDDPSFLEESTQNIPQEGEISHPKEWPPWDPIAENPWEKSPENQSSQEEIIPLDEMEIDKILSLLLKPPKKEKTKIPHIEETPKKTLPPENNEKDENDANNADNQSKTQDEDDQTEKDRKKTGSSENLDIYYREIREFQPLSLEEEIELGTKYKKQGCKKSFEKMVNANLKLVVYIAKRFRRTLKMFPASMSFSDLINEGNIGLLKAIERYDPEKKNKISTYASWWITQQIQLSIQKQSKIIRIPTHLIKRMQKIQRIIDEYQKLHNTKIPLDLSMPKPLMDQLEKSGIKPSDVESLKDLLNLSGPTISLDDPSLMGNSQNNPEGQSLHETIKDEKAENPFEKSASLAQSLHMDSILSELTPKEKLVLEERYGLKTHEEKTLEQVGSILGITRERVRQIQEKALKKLKTKLLEQAKMAELHQNNPP